MNIEIEKSNLKKYIKISNIYDLEKEQLQTKRSDYELKMIVNNHINHIIHPSVRVVNGDMTLYFDVSTKIDLKTISERCEFKSKELIQIIRTLDSVINNTYEYLLNVEGISLNCEHIFLDTNTGEVFFIYIPNNNVDIYKTLESFSEFLLMTTDHDDDKAVDIVYSFYAMIQEKNLNFGNMISGQEPNKSDERNDKKLSKQEIEEIYDTRELISNEVAIETGNSFCTVSENKKRIRPLSLVCMLLFFVSVALGALVCLFNSRLFRYIFSNSIVISLSSVYLSIILYIPVSDALQVITYNAKARKS